MITRTEHYDKGNVKEGIFAMEEARWCVRQICSYPVYGMTHFLVVFERDAE